MVPLVIHNPYFGLWSPSDRLNESTTKHWTNRDQRLQGLIRVDGKVLRVIGRHPPDAPALPQTSLRVLPTRTVYTFGNDQIKLTLTFLTPVLPDDIDVLARPLSYVAWEVESADGKGHDVAVFLGLGGEVAVDSADQVVKASREQLDGLVAARVGTVSQNVLRTAGDDRRIDWGYAWIAACLPRRRRDRQRQGSYWDVCRQRHAPRRRRQGATPGRCRRHHRRRPVLGSVTAATSVYQMLAYDEQFSLQYTAQEPEALLATRGCRTGATCSRPR